MNRKGPFFLIRVIVLFGLFFVFSNSVSAADRYWVGGTATWDSTAGSKWSTTSGGTGDQAVPTAADDVYFDAASGANTITLSSSSLGRSINFTGFTGTISHPSATTLTIGDATAGAGSIALKMVAGMTYTLSSVTTSALSFVSTSATQQTITAGGKTFGNVTINSTSNGDYAFTDAITLGSTATLTLTKGTLHTDGIADNSGLSHSWGLFNSNNSNTRTLSLGASSITITGGTGSAVAMNTTTGLTLNAGSSTVTLSGASQTFRVGDSAGGGKTWNNVVFSG